jgi:hypothetical protein
MVNYPVWGCLLEDGAWIAASLQYILTAKQNRLIIYITTRLDLCFVSRLPRSTEGKLEKLLPREKLLPGPSVFTPTLPARANAILSERCFCMAPRTGSSPRALFVDISRSSSGMDAARVLESSRFSTRFVKLSSEVNVEGRRLRLYWSECSDAANTDGFRGLKPTGDAGDSSAGEAGSSARVSAVSWLRAVPGPDESACSALLLVDRVTAPLGVADVTRLGFAEPSLGLARASSSRALSCESDVVGRRLRVGSGFVLSVLLCGAVTGREFHTDSSGFRRTSKLGRSSCFSTL